MKKLTATILAVVMLFTAISLFGCGMELSTELDFSQITINCLGDSITYGTQPNSPLRASNPWPQLLKQYLGLKAANNYGVPSSCLGQNSAGKPSMVERVDAMSGDAQIVCVLGGANDVEFNVPLGELSDMAPDTIYGALNFLAERLREKFPAAFVFFMTPFPMTEKWQSLNTTGVTMADVAQAVKGVCQKHGLPCLDLFESGNFKSEMFLSRSDGLHPTQRFFKNNTVPQIARFLESHYEQIPNHKPVN